MDDGCRIVTARLTLRRARLADLDDLHAILSDPRAMRYWSTPEHETRAESAAWVQKMVAATASDEFVLELSGKVIGKAGCWRPGEIGYILHPDHWGHGYMREALNAILPWIFARHDLAALIAEVDPRNAGSLRLLKGLGFRETHRESRTMQWRDEWCDSVYLSLPRP